MHRVETDGRSGLVPAFPFLRGRSSGFTLIELLAVMAIIGILVGIGFKGYRLAQRQAKEAQAMADLEKLRLALDEYRVEFGTYPGQVAVAAVPRQDFLSECVEGLQWADPWGNAYLYVCTNRFRYRLWSTGQNPELDGDNIESSKSGY